MGVVGILRRYFVRLILFILLGCAFNVNGSQFSGGLITFKPTGNGADLLIEYRLSWNRSIYFCNDSTISNNGLIGETGNITCFKGCEMDQPSQVNCTHYSVTDDWSYGRNSFIYTPPSTNSTFSFGYTGRAWITLIEGGGNWSMKTTADVSVRPDTKRINSSPTLEISPAVLIQQGCSHIIKLPIIDPDGDIVRCRFANGTDECAGVCNGFPNATMDKNTCSISYNATDAVGWYAVAIQMEDFQTPSSTTPLSSVSVQFLVKVFNSTSSCDSGPEFVYPTPPEDTCFPLAANDSFAFRVTAFTTSLGRNISTINTIGTIPSSLATSSTTNTTGSYMSMDMSWTLTEASKGNNVVCFTAVDSLGLRSEQRCVNMFVEAKPVLLEYTKSENGSTIEMELIYNKRVTGPIDYDTSPYIQVFYDNGTIYEQIDVSSTNVMYMTSSIMFSLTVELTLSYYILLDQGIVLGGCSVPSDAINNVTLIVIKAKDCSQPPNVSYGSLIFNSTLYGGTVTITCETGYNMTSGDDVLTCGADEQWSGELPTCTIVDCGQLPPIANGSVTVTGTTFGENATYNCDPGFEIIETCDSGRVCTPEGTWDGQEPYCIIEGDPYESFILFADSALGKIFKMNMTSKSYVEVAIGGSPVALDYDILNSRIYWTDVHVGEIRSLTIDGNDEQLVYSMGNGSTPRNGLALDSISHLIFYTDATFSHIASLHYDGSSNTVIINSDIQNPRDIALDTSYRIMYWTDWGTQPKIESALYDGSNRHTIVSTGIIWPNGLTIDTQAGKIYWVDGGTSNIEVCDIDGSNRRVLLHESGSHYFGIRINQNTLYFTDWSKTGIRTLPTSGGQPSDFGPQSFINLNGIYIYKNSTPGCLHPPSLSHGSLIVNSTLYGGTVTANCETGYNMTSGDEVRTCGVDGKWSGEPPTCIIVACLHPPSLSHGSLIVNSTLYGGTVTANCETGYNMISGDEVRTCGVDGKWSGEPPTCTVVGCLHPPSLSHGSLIVNSALYGGMVTANCETGYNMTSGDEVRTCGVDGKWSGEPPTCTIVDCLSPPSIIHATLNVTGTTYDETVYYNCDNGYFTREGNMESKCDATGQWTGKTLVCAAKYATGDSCLSDLPDVNQCQMMNVTCRFDSSVGDVRCICTVGLVYYEKEDTCINSIEYGGTCKISSQCNTFLSKCAVGPSGEGTCICKSGLTFNETSNECVSKAILHCEKSEDKRGMMWEKMEIGTTLYNECPNGYTGWISRTCKQGGIFSLAFYNCTKDIFKDIALQLEKENLTTSEALETLKDAVSDFEKNDTEIFPGDVDAIEDSLAQIADREPDPSASPEELKQDADSFLHIADLLTDPIQSGDVWGEKIEMTNKGAERFIETVDKYSEKLANSIMSTNQTQMTITKNNLVVSVSNIPNNTDDVLQYPDRDQKPNWETTRTSSFTLDSAALANAGQKLTSVVVTVYRDISKALPTTNAQKETQTNDRYINSQVLSIQLLPTPPSIIDPPLSLTFRKDEHGKGFEAHCSFWKPGDGSTRGGWSTFGCVKTMSSATMVKCSCNHLTNFAILISPVEAPSDHADALSAITLTGCGISIVFLIITILIHVAYWRYLKGDRNVLAMAVCASLLVAYVLFVFGINRTSVKGLCTTIAVFLHYTFLLVFFLMLSEMIYMALQVVFLFHKRSHLRELLIGSFVLPAVIVLIVASATNLQGYGNEKYCWLTINSVAFWMFAGPAVIVILFNMLIIVLIMKKMYGTKWMQDMNQKEKAKTLVGKMLVLLPVMGVTWVFGILAVDENSVALQYLFVIFNSFQGVFIFVFHCVMNKQLRSGIEKSGRKLSSLPNESSKLHTRSDPSTSGITTHTTVDPHSIVHSCTVKANHVNEPATEKVTETHDMALLGGDGLAKHLPPAATEEERNKFKKRHGIPTQVEPGEKKPKRPPTQVFIDLQFELRVRLRNMVSAVSNRASKAFSSAQPTTLALKRHMNKDSFHRENSEEQIHIMAGDEYDDIAGVAVIDKADGDRDSMGSVAAAHKKGATGQDNREPAKNAVRFSTVSNSDKEELLKRNTCIVHADPNETDCIETNRMG